MDINLVYSVGLSYESGTLEEGSYKVYHTSINTNNLMDGFLYTHNDLYNGITFLRENFPSSLITKYENDEQYEFVIEKIS